MEVGVLCFDVLKILRPFGEKRIKGFFQMEVRRTDTLAERIIAAIKNAAEMYYRLVLVVGESGSGKTAGLQEVRRLTRAPVINVNLELSRQMLDLTARQRALQLPRMLKEIASGKKRDAFLLDNIEMIFDVALRQDPLRLLKGLSRNQTTVAAWPGLCDGQFLTYAAPGHPEYRRYGKSDLGGLILVSSAG